MKKKNKLRIGFVGAHGTGKSTLLNEMDHPYKIQEIARSVIKMGKHPNDMDLFERYQFQKRLLYKQAIEETRLFDKGFISDRTIFDIIAYTDSLIKDENINTGVGQMLIDAIGFLKQNFVKDNSDRYDILFYTPIEFPLEKDGIRFEDEEYQKEIDSLIVELLDTYQIKYFILTGSVEERMKKINDIIDIYSF